LTNAAAEADVASTEGLVVRAAVVGGGINRNSAAVEQQ